MIRKIISSLTYHVKSKKLERKSHYQDLIISGEKNFPNFISSVIKIRDNLGEFKTALQPLEAENPFGSLILFPN